RQSTQLVVEAVGVQFFRAVLLESAPVVLIRSTTRHELEIDAARHARIAAETSGFDRDFLDGPEPGRHRTEEARAAALEAARRVVDAVAPRRGAGVGPARVR